MKTKEVSLFAKRGKRAYEQEDDVPRAAALESLLVKLQAAQQRREVSREKFFQQKCDAPPDTRPRHIFPSWVLGFVVELVKLRWSRWWSCQRPLILP